MSVVGEVSGVWVVVKSFFGVFDVASVCGEESWLGGAEEFVFGWVGAESFGECPDGVWFVKESAGSS